MGGLLKKHFKVFTSLIRGLIKGSSPNQAILCDSKGQEECFESNF